MPYIRWRWDQGRERYWRFHNIRDLSQALLRLNGVRLSGPSDPLTILRAETELPFQIPAGKDDYTIWRQYARVIRSLLLATKCDEELVVSDICKRVASEDPLTIDEFLFVFAVRFYSPPPFGSNYEPTRSRVFPICAILRFLLANLSEDGRSKVDLETVFSKLIGNICVGNEPLEYYRQLTATEYVSSGNDESRQVRELIKFVAQFSFLHWDGTHLHLELPLPSGAEFQAIEARLQPLDWEPEADRDSELLSLGRITDQDRIVFEPMPLVLPPSLEDKLFVEGSKTRVTHLVTERNRKLRENYMKYRALQHTPILCDFRGCDIQSLYPWADNLLEVHHLLPLSSGMIIETSGTSFKHLTAVCPNCHKAIHCYYRLWLNEREKRDFSNMSEAFTAFQEAQSQLSI